MPRDKETRRLGCVRQRQVQNVEQHVQIAGPRHKGFVFFHDHDLCVAQPREIGVAQIPLQFVVGRAAEAAELWRNNRSSDRPGSLFDQHARGQMAEAAANHRHIERSRRMIVAWAEGENFTFGVRYPSGGKNTIERSTSSRSAPLRDARQLIVKVKGGTISRPACRLISVDDGGDGLRAADIVPVHAALREKLELIAALERMDQARGIQRHRCRPV